ncbi:MAG TPA: hypothetical protein VHD36_12460 [Pirellulales bacterium]|nr:hypothetical protein [Pirellulales bacterium]
MPQLTREQIEANLQEKVGRMPGEDTQAYILRKQNEAALSGKQRREAQTQVTREQVEARIAGIDAKRALDRDAAEARRVEQAKLAAENPFRQILDSESVTLSKGARKRFKDLAASRDEQNAAEKVERERIAALEASPAYQAALKQSAAWIEALPDEFKQQARNNQAALTTTYDVDRYYAAMDVLVQQARESLDASLAEYFAESAAIDAKAQAIEQQRAAIQ